MTPVADRVRLLALDDLRRAFYLLDDVLREVERRTAVRYTDQEAAQHARRDFDTAHSILKRQLEALNPMHE